MYTVLLVAALAGATPAQMYPGCYGGPQVQHVTASVKAGDVVVHHNLVRYVPVTEQRMVRAKDKDGNPIEVRETHTFTIAIAQAATEIYKADKVQFLDHQGNKMSAAQALDQLAKETPVLAVQQGQPLDPAYLSLLKAGTLVLVLPMNAPSGSGGKEMPKEKAMPKGEDLPKPKPLPLPSKAKASPTSFIREGPKAEVGMQPTLARASIDAKGVMHILEGAEASQTVMTKVVEDVNGVMVERAVPIRITRSVTVKRAVDAKWVKAHGVDGKPIDAAVLAAVLRESTIVLVASDGKAVDPYFLQIIREGTIVLVPPATINFGSSRPPEPIPVPKGDPFPKKV